MALAVKELVNIPPVFTPDLEDRRLGANVFMARALQLRNEAATLNKLSNRHRAKVQERLLYALKLEQLAEWINTP